MSRQAYFWRQTEDSNQCLEMIARNVLLCILTERESAGREDFVSLASGKLYPPSLPLFSLSLPRSLVLLHSWTDGLAGVPERTMMIMQPL